MSRLRKYKTFEEAARAIVEEAVFKGPVKPVLTTQKEHSLQHVGNPYKPGLYRFRSWEEAAEYDRKQYIQQAINKKPGC